MLADWRAVAQCRGVSLRHFHIFTISHYSFCLTLLKHLVGLRGENSKLCYFLSLESLTLFTLPFVPSFNVHFFLLTSSSYIYFYSEMQ